MTTTEFSWTTTPLGEGAVAVALTGELDLCTAARVEPTLSHLARSAEGELLLDLAGVPFCDSSGAALFLRTHRRCAAAGVRLRLRGVQNLPGRVLRLTGVDRNVPCSFG